MDMAAILQDACSRLGKQVTVTHTPKTVRVENEDVEGGFYEYLSSDVTITFVCYGSPSIWPTAENPCESVS